MPRACARDGLRTPRSGNRLDRHAVRPVHPVAVFDGETDRRAHGAAVADPGGPLHAVALDLHPLAAAVAVLPPPQVEVDLPGSHAHASRKSLEHPGQRRSV